MSEREYRVTFQLQGRSVFVLAGIRAQQQAAALARRTQHVELSTDANFQMQFAESMIFPDAPYLTV